MGNGLFGGGGGAETGLPGMKDDTTRMVRLLEQIAENTRDIDAEHDIRLEGARIDQRIGVLPHNAIVITETADMDLESLNPDGTITIEPGDKRKIAEYREGDHGVLAYGAVDEPDLVYWLEVDGTPVVGPTRSPLGTINSPFSFVDVYGGAVPSEERTEVIVSRPDDATGSVDVAARLHVEMLPQ